MFQVSVSDQCVRSLYQASMSCQCVRSVSMLSLSDQSVRLISQSSQSGVLVPEATSGSGQGNTPQVLLNQQAGANNNNNPVSRICRYYKTMTCKYGPKGVGCPYSHPKKCPKFLKHGKKAGGCKKDRCGLYHPPLCWSSSNLGTCDRKKCRYQHLQGTKRNLNAEQAARADSVASPRPTYAQAAGAISERPPYGHREESEDRQQDFLEMRREVRQMQEMMRKILDRDRYTQIPPRDCQRCHNDR